MDPAFLPSTLVVKHFVEHKFVLELGPSIINLGKPIRNVILFAVGIYCVRDIFRLSLQAVLKTSRDDREH